MLLTLLGQLADARAIGWLFSAASRLGMMLAVRMSVVMVALVMLVDMLHCGAHVFFGRHGVILSRMANDGWSGLVLYPGRDLISRINIFTDG